MDLKSIMSESKVGIVDLIEMAIRVAATDCGEELRRRRDSIVEALYASSSQVCRNCECPPPRENTGSYNHVEDDSGRNKNAIQDFGKSTLALDSDGRNYSERNEDDGDDPFANLFDDEQTEILNIKEQLEDPHKGEEGVLELLQTLADMDISFQDLQETDIGRHVNRLRKHPSNEVRRLVKLLDRKWKETADQWVNVDSDLPRENTTIIADEVSPQQDIPENRQNAHHQVREVEYSLSPQAKFLIPLMCLQIGWFCFLFYMAVHTQSS